MFAQLAGGCYYTYCVHTVQAEACEVYKQWCSAVYVYPAFSAATATV
jgi:hypothetical protein